MIAQGIPKLQIHFIECGQGNMVLAITPDLRVLLFDCRVVEDTQDEIINYLEGYIPNRPDPENKREARQWIDWFVCSHRDDDHFHGLKILNQAFPIRGIVDSGTTSGSTTGDENEYYMYLRRDLRNRYGDRAVIEPKPSLSPLFSFGGTSFYCLCSGVDDEMSDDGHYGNVVVQIEYAGNRILLPGDSDWRAWKEKIVPTFVKYGLLKATVLLASHHGSRSFFVDIDPFDDDDHWDEAYVKHLEFIDPSMTIISCGEQEHQNHPDPAAREKYEDHTSHEQVYLTRDKGTLVGCFYENGDWTVIPSRFLDNWNYARYTPAGKKFWLNCEDFDERGQSVGQIRSGSFIPKGHSLLFTAGSSGGLIGNWNNASCWFEVSNGGTGTDADHDDIYYKKSNETGPVNKFKREVRYAGVHLLRCRVRDRISKQEAQDIFVVRGL